MEGIAWSSRKWFESSVEFKEFLQSHFFDQLKRGGGNGNKLVSQWRRSNGFAISSCCFPAGAGTGYSPLYEQWIRQ